MAYCQLTGRDRFLIEFHHGKGMGVRAIAREIDRSPSTVSRELKRNRRAGKAYEYSSAAHSARMRRRGQNRLRILREPWLQKEVDEGFRKAWSAEQIAGRLRLGPVRKPISFNAIYRYFRRLVESGSEKLKDFPRRPAKRRRKRISLFGPLGKKPVCDRPEAALLRQEQGHFEGDTIVSSPGRPAVLVFVCRKSRFILARKINKTGSETITQETILAFQKAGKYNRKTITLDNGREFAGYRDMERKLKIPVYFCEPHSPWQRPTVENTNGLIRQLTRKVNLVKFTQNGLQKVVNLLNNRPRKCLNYLTPAEVFG